MFLAKALEEGSLRALGFIWMKFTKKKKFGFYWFYEVPGFDCNIPEAWDLPFPTSGGYGKQISLLVLS